MSQDFSFKVGEYMNFYKEGHLSWNLHEFSPRRRRRKLALFMQRIINFQQMIRCKEVLLRKDWRIINLLRVAGLQEDGPG